MAHEVVMPRLGWTMETGRLVEWLKHDGDAVQAGENLFTVESDKAVVEVEALDSGVLTFAPDAPPADTDLPVGTVLAYLLAPDEPVPWAESGPPAQLDQNPMGHSIVADADNPNSTTDSSQATHNGNRSNGAAAISPRALRVANELGVDWSALKGSGKSGRIREADVRAANSSARSSERRATPLARRVAAEHGIDLAHIAPAGNRIARADVDAVLPKGAPAAVTGGAPLSPTRRIIAGRMRESVATAAAVTLTTEADVTELVALRNRIKDDHDVAALVPSFNDVLVRIVALVLRDHPALNSSLVDETIVEHSAVHVGIAVDTPRGLLVPVVRDAHQRSLGEITVESARIIERARSGKATGEELSGSTFTISNLGMYEIDAFTPIINLPECAILGVGRIVARPVVVDEANETVGVRRMMTLSLTFDHRIVDGAPAARFLQQIKRFVEHPYRWITQ